MTHPLVQFLSRPGVRVGLGASAVVATVAFVSLGAFTAGGSAGGVHGPGLNISIVAPVEPDVEPGSTMEVGALTDGFDRASLERRAELEDYGDLPLDAYAGGGDDAWTSDAVYLPPRQMPAARQPEPQPTPPVDALADGSRAFGFDRPQPDYAAQREQRMSRLNAPAGQTTETSQPVAYTEAIKYSSE